MKKQIERLQQLSNAYKNALEYDYAQEEHGDCEGCRPDEIANKIIREIDNFPKLI